MRSLDLWRLCDELNIVQAALLVCEYKNPDIWEYVESWDLDRRPQGYEAMKMAITVAVRTERVKGRVQLVNSSDANIVSSIDYYESLVEVDSLKEWLSTKGYSSCAFITGQPPAPAGLKQQAPPAVQRRNTQSAPVVSPDYLNKYHPSYSPKLAAAIRAWEALQTDTNYNGKGKTIKGNLESWLSDHAADFDLVNGAGEVLKSTIGDIARVANWRPIGGAPKTPELNPPVDNNNPPPNSKTTEAWGFDDDEFHIPLP